jgi:hypothetical protein
MINVAHTHTKHFTLLPTLRFLDKHSIPAGIFLLRIGTDLDEVLAQQLLGDEIHLVFGEIFLLAAQWDLENQLQQAFWAAGAI